METVAKPPTQITGVLTPLDISASNRERPKTMLTPDVKRAKIVAMANADVVLAFPTSIPIPSKRVIKTLYETSTEGHEEGQEKKSDNKDQYNDQRYLAPAGILSFENVLLPAVGFEEENAIKRVQSKVQRDIPGYKFLVEDCRKLVRKSIRSAMEAVQGSRSARFECQKQRKNEQLLETKKAREIRQCARREKQERLAKELIRRREILKTEKRRHLARNSLRNQDLWKEIVFLTSSVALLEREERMWIQIEKDVMRLEGRHYSFGEKEDGNDFSDQQSSCDIPSSSLSHPSDIFLDTKKCFLQDEAEDVVKDIILTSTRIQKGLKIILKILNRSETSRKELFEKYKKDHVFTGYQSVHNPKRMIRFLSQSQDDHL